MHGLNRTDVRALVAIMDAARGGRALTAGPLGAAVDRSRVVLEMSDSAMAAGAERFGGLQRDLTAAIERHSCPTP